MVVRVKTLSLIDTIACMCILFLILSAFFPYITTFGNNAILCLVSELLWLLLTFLQSKETIASILSKYWYTIPYMIYAAVVPYLFGNSSIGNRYMYTFGLVFGLYIFSYYHKLEKMDVLGTAIKISLPFLLYTIARTFFASVYNPWVIRQIDNTSTVELLRQGIGGYHFIYLLTIIFALAFVSALNGEKSNRLLAIIVSALSFMLVVLSNYFTALVVCFVCAAIAAANKFVRKPIYLVFIALILVFVFILTSSGEIKSVFLGILNPNGRIYSAFGSSTNSLLQSFVEEFFSDRWPAYRRSIDSFFGHPLFGIITSPIANDGTYDTSYGQHSHIIDTFALYGFGIGIVGTALLFAPFKHKVYKDGGKVYGVVICIALLIITMFNNITHSVAMGATLVSPYIVYILCEKRKRLGESNVLSNKQMQHIDR